MEDLIRRSDAIKAIYEARRAVPLKGALTDTMSWAIARANAIPTIEPKRGEWIEWIDCEGEVFWKCSACGQVSEASAADILYKFCPFCGADMREREGE